MEPAVARRATLERRRALRTTEVESLSEQLTARFFAFCTPPGATWRGVRVGLYRALGGETNLEAIEKRLRAEGAQLYFPRVLPRGEVGTRLMEFALVPANVAESERWRVGAHGIEEPRERFPATDPAVLDLVFVPGVAFGPAGERVGMGVGYYDRFLPGAVNALRVALAFDFQLVDALVQNTWDQRMHWVLTEKREVLADEVRVQAWRQGGTQ